MCAFSACSTQCSSSMFDGIVKIADAQQPLSFVDTFFGQHRRVVLFVDDVIAGLLAVLIFFAALRAAE